MQKKEKRLFLFFYNCKFSPVEENPLGIPINIKVSKTHLCSVSDQFVTQWNEMALQKYYLEQILMSAKCYSRIMYWRDECHAWEVKGKILNTFALDDIIWWH